MRKKFILLFSLVLNQFLFAQEAIVTTGGDVYNSSGSVSSSIGLIDYTSTTTLKGSFSEGIQQPYTIFKLTLREEQIPEILSKEAESNDISNTIELYCLVYPNPITDNLFLKGNFAQSDNFNFQLFNATSQLLLQAPIINELTSINMSFYSSGTYYLKVLEGANEIKYFKIIKL